MSKLHVRLFRDSFNTPWGIRLQGGKDLGQVLCVQRVFSNSPADGEIQRGDHILSIGVRETHDLTHKQALNLIKQSGGQLQLVVQRPQVLSSMDQKVPNIRPQKPRAPSLPQQTRSDTPNKFWHQQDSTKGFCTTFGSDYAGYRSLPRCQGITASTTASSPHKNVKMINRVQGSLDRLYLTPSTQSSNQYIPTGIRLDMERETETMRQHQQRRENENSKIVHEQPLMNFTATSIQFELTPSHHEQRVDKIHTANIQTPVYVPTGALLDTHTGANEEEDFLPVWERRKAFMKSSSPKLGAKKQFSAGVEGDPPGTKNTEINVGWQYATVPRQSSTSPWKPQSADQPMQEHFSIHNLPKSFPNTGNVTNQTVGISQKLIPVPISPIKSLQWDFAPNPPDSIGSHVVHLQYNSPIDLYSTKNVQETFDGQTKALMMGNKSNVQPVNVGQNKNNTGRNWSQSELGRMNQEQVTHGKAASSMTFSSQNMQQNIPSKPQHFEFQHQVLSMNNEIGMSDF